jgi:hypothetical protein
MKKVLFMGVCAATMAASTAVYAGPIDRACRQSSRAGATPQLCSCIQGVANESLSRTDMRKVAKWFGDPHKAQEARQSSSSNDNDLWKRYKAFGERASQVCG